MTHRGRNIRVLCSPRALLPHGSANLSPGPSAFSVSPLDSANDHGHPVLDHDDRGHGTNTPPPCPVQIGVCPQSRTTPTPQTAAVRVTQSCTATATVAVIPPHSLDAENAFSEEKEDPLHSSWTRNPETPAHGHHINAAADLSPCNGTPAILDKHDAHPDRDENERTRPDTTPSVPTSQAIRQHFVPLDIAHDTYDASLTNMSDDVVLFWQPPSVFSQWTPSPFTVGLVNYTCAEQFMMASKARLLGDDSALSAILATDDPREQKRIGRQIRHFDHELWQQKCDNIVLQGNLAKFSQNDEMRLALIHTGQRRLAEASPHDKLWGIGLSACDYRVSSPSTWRGSNLLGQALEHVRETLHSKSMPQLSRFLQTDTTDSTNHPGDTVFEVDPITRIRLNMAPVTIPPHNTILSALLMDSVPDDHAPEVLLTNTTRTDKPFVSEQGPDLISGVVTIGRCHVHGPAVLNKRCLGHISIPLPCPPGYGISAIIHPPTDSTNHPGDTVFEVDPITRIRLNMAPVTIPPHNTILSALMDSVPDDHAPEVLLTNTTRTDTPFVSEQGPDLISGVVTIGRRHVHGPAVLNKRCLGHISIPLPCPPGYGISAIIHPPGCL